MKNKNSIAIIIIALFFSNNFSVLGQNLHREKIVVNYIRSSLISDIFYYLEFKKDEIPKCSFGWMDETIPVNFKRFKIIPDGQIYSVKKFLLNRILEKKNDYNYVVFSSPLQNNYVMVDIFFHRDTFLNRPADSLYEEWRRFNGGVSYLFKFEENGCLLDIQKTSLCYD